MEKFRLTVKLYITTMKKFLTYLGMLLASVPCSHAATIIQNFEGVTTPSIPNGWTTVGSPVTAANGNPGNSIVGQSGSTNYIVNSGAGFDANFDISGSFDFYIVESGNYSNGAFFFGNVQSGLGSSAGDHLRIDLRERTFGARANILDANGTTLFDGSANNNFRIDSNAWYSAVFSWTAATNTFNIDWTGPNNVVNVNMTVSGYSLNSSEVFFGFGTVDDEARFDNINITGVPEPSVAMFSSLACLAFFIRRRS